MLKAQQKCSGRKKAKGVCKLVLHNFPQVVSVGVEASLLGGAQHPEDVLGGVEVDQHCEAVVGFLHYVIVC